MNLKIKVLKVSRAKAMMAATAIIGICCAARSAHTPVPTPRASSPESKPQISGMHVAKVSFDRLLLHWQTDRPATSQVVAVDLATQQEINLVGDLVLRTDHWVWVSGLKPATEYAFQAMSVSYAYGKAIASPIFEQTALKPTVHR